MPSFLFRRKKLDKKRHNPLCSLLGRALAEEKLSGKKYVDVATVAEKEGEPEVAEILRDLGEDEEDHRRTLKDLYEDLECQK